MQIFSNNIFWKLHDEYQLHVLKTWLKFGWQDPNKGKATMFRIYVTHLIEMNHMSEISEYEYYT